METAGKLLPHIRSWPSLRLYPVGGSEQLACRDEGRKTRRGDGFAPSLCLSQLQVEAEKEGKEIFLFLHAVGAADGGVEGGMGIAEAVSAGGLAGAIEFAQGAVVALRDRTGRSRAGPSRARSSPD